MKSSPKSLLFIILLLCAHFFVKSQTQNWQQVHTVIPRLVTSMGNTLIAAGNFGFYVSVNKGNTWIQRNGAYSNLEVYSLAMNGSDIYIGTGNDFGAGVLKSTDMGLSWSVLTPTMIGGDDVRSMIIHNNNIYIGTRGYLGDGVYKSSLSNISSQSWSIFNMGLASKDVMDFAVCGSKIFAATECGGVFMSDMTNAGWGLSPTNTLNPTGCYYQIISSGGVMYTGGDTPLYTSTNCGLSWQPVNNLMGVSRIIALEKIGNLFMVGMEIGTAPQISNNATSSFTVFGNGLITTPQKNVTTFAVIDDTLFIGNGTGVWRLDTVPKGPQVNTGIIFNEATSTVKLEAYPNPTSDRLYLKHNLSASAELTMKIYNGLGELIDVKTMLGQEMSFSTAELKSQLYHILVSDASGKPIGRQTFLIQR